jgi:hypothetical protein
MLRTDGDQSAAVKSGPNPKLGMAHSSVEEGVKRNDVSTPLYKPPPIIWPASFIPEAPELDQLGPSIAPRVSACPVGDQSTASSPPPAVSEYPTL